MYRKWMECLPGDLEAECALKRVAMLMPLTMKDGEAWLCSPKGRHGAVARFTERGLHKHLHIHATLTAVH